MEHPCNHKLIRPVDPGWCHVTTITGERGMEHPCNHELIKPVDPGWCHVTTITGERGMEHPCNHELIRPVDQGWCHVSTKFITLQSHECHSPSNYRQLNYLLNCQ